VFLVDDEFDAIEFSRSRFGVQVLSGSDVIRFDARARPSMPHPLWFAFVSIPTLVVHFLTPPDRQGNTMTITPPCPGIHD
jgi:hypothetical protein